MKVKIYHFDIYQIYSLHLGRHTFATTVTLNNNIPIETVSKMLGHSRINTTQIYVKILEKKVGEDMLEIRDLQ